MIRTVFAVAAFALAVPALADVPASELVSAEVWNGDALYPTAPGSYSAGSSQLTIATDPTPSLLAIAKLAPGTGRALVGAEYKYSFVLNGPGSDLVPLEARIVAAVHIVNGTGVQASGGASISVSAASSLNVALGTSPGFDYDQSFDQTLGFFARPGEVNTVDLQASANLDGDSSHFGGFASAYADPYFTIDPAFAGNHPGYSLSFSPGVGNAPAGAVPEPATWALLLAGFSLTGVIMRRRGGALVAS